MNIPDNTVKAVQQPSLPPLTKGSTTYKLFVPRKVEEKIRYLCRKFPTLEWSGILFTTYEGNFEDGSLKITCQDLYPMDLGSATFTDFKMDETVAGYVAENIELFGCDMQLIHSHNQMAAFFSGTDQSTLRSEGNDQNCFVSLIVNNAGTYCAAVTRKIKVKKEITTTDLGSSYEFFGEGNKPLNSIKSIDTKTVVDEESIEYFMLDVEIEHVDNPLAYLDTRFDEIQEKKKKVIVNPPVVKASEGNKNPWLPNNRTSIVNPASRAFGNDFDEDYSFRDWQKWQESGRKESAKVKESLYGKEQTIFSEEEMNEMVDTSGWEPDPTIIHKLVCQMVTCSLIVSDNIDLKQWVTRWIDKKYKEIFGPDCNESPQFQEWKDFIVEFAINQYMMLENDMPDALIDDYDLLQSKVASAIHNELYQYNTSGNNAYINDYMEVLTRYIYE